MYRQGSSIKIFACIFLASIARDGGACVIIMTLVPMLGLPLVLMSVPRKFVERSRRRVFLAVIILLCVITTKNALLSWSLIGAFALILRGASRFFQFRAEKALIEALPLFLDRVILNLKAGKALKQALRESARELSPAAKERWNEISDRLDLAGSDDDLSPAERELLRGFRNVGTAKVTERLEGWRHSLRLREEFRRKSGQVTLQVRAQAALAIFLFAPVFLWNVFGVEHVSIRRCATALALFVLAQVWIHVVFRRWKWTV